MTTYLIYSDPSDGELRSYATNYTTARNGTGVTLNAHGANTIAVGQNVDGAGNKYVYQGFFSFDTSVIVDAEEIMDATLNIYSGWTGNNQSIQWGQQFYVCNWTAPLTTTQWQNMSSYNVANIVANMDYLNPSTPFKNRYTGADSLINAINKTAPLKLVSFSNWELAGWAPTATQEIWVNSGETANAPCLIVYTTPLTTMNVVGNAAVSLPDGTHVSVRSNGASVPTLTVGYTPLNGAFTSLGTLDPKFSNTLDSQNSIAITADPSGNFFIFGTLAGTAGTLVGQAWVRTGTTNVWTAKTPLTQVQPMGNNQTIRSISAVYIKGGSNANDKTGIYMVLARGGGGISPPIPYHVGGAGWAHDSFIDPANMLAGTGSLNTNTTTQYAPHTACAVPAYVDMVALDSNVCAVYVNRGKFDQTTVGGISTINIYGGGGYPIANDSTYVATGVSKLVAVSANTFAHVFDNGGANLTIRFYNKQCQILGSTTLDASLFTGGVIGDKFNAYYDTTSNLLRVYYMSVAGGTTVSRYDVSPTTFTGTFTLGETSTFGAASSTSTGLRMSHGGYMDERVVTLSASNLAATALSTVAYNSTAGNIAPNAPVLVAQTNFDATSSKVFNWKFADTNPADAQTAFDIEFSNAGTGTVVLAPAKIISSLSSYTLAASGLSNGVNYRWRVRTYDTIGTQGTWSNYNNFTTASTGTLTITAPATDDMAGIDTSSYTVAWTYTQSGGQTQAQRQVKVTRTADNVVISDSTMQASTANTYLISSLESDKEYRIDVTIINSASVNSGTVSRLITPSYAQPMTPTLVATAYDSYTGVQITNPVPTGSEPEVLYNDIYRRLTGVATDSWIRIATVGNGSLYRDYAVKSNTSYDYYVTGRTS